MSNTQMNENYERDDIYYCECCGLFYHIATNALVPIGLDEIPADFAIQVMADRQKSNRGNHFPSRQSAQNKPKGFGK